MRNTRDDRFFPCNRREADILAGFGAGRNGSARLDRYKELRNGGATVTEAIDALPPIQSEPIPCNGREEGIIERLSGEKLDTYKWLRQIGATVTDALNAVAYHREEVTAQATLDVADVAPKFTVWVGDRWAVADPDCQHACNTCGGALAATGTLAGRIHYKCVACCDWQSHPVPVLQ